MYAHILCNWIFPTSVFEYKHSETYANGNVKDHLDTKDVLNILISQCYLMYFNYFLTYIPQKINSIHQRTVTPLLPKVIWSKSLNKY